jgi:hypothetical protein
VQKLLKTSANKFPAAVLLRITPPLDLADPPVAKVLLRDDVVLPPLGQLDVNMPVDV